MSAALGDVVTAYACRVAAEALSNAALWSDDPSSGTALDYAIEADAMNVYADWLDGTIAESARAWREAMAAAETAIARELAGPVTGPGTRS